MKILADMTKAELTAYITEEFSVKAYVASQVFDWILKGADFDRMTDVSKQLRTRLKEKCIAVSAKIIEKRTSEIDGTEKYLFELFDGNIVEGVLMNYKYGNTLCVSTQVGCRMGCKFCASTLKGLIRNLSAGEILGQVLAVNATHLSSVGRYVTNIVLMGSGEPLDNFDNTVSFLRLVTAKEGINVSERNISLSTCGIAPRIRELAELDFSINLTLSLHSADEAKRKEIMPIANKYSVEEIMEAARYYFTKTGRRIIVEYTLIDGKNDSFADALKLASVLRNMSVHVNLIKLNAVKETGLRASRTESSVKFAAQLKKLGISATERRTLGADIEGACGQLRNKFVGQKQP